MSFANRLPLLFALALWVPAVCSAPARAQPATPAETADSLFDDGVAARERGDYPRAYESFRKSLALDPAPGTLLNIALCEEKLGKLVDARAHFEEVLKQLPAGDDRAPIARGRIEAIQPLLVRLTLRLDSNAPNGTRVAVDGVEVAAADLGAARLLDPGAHVVVVTAPGRTERQVPLTLEPGGSVERVLQPGEPVPAPSASASAPAAGPTASLTSTAMLPPEPPRSRQSSVGFVLLGAGVLGLAVGAITGGLVLDAKATVDADCDVERDVCKSQAGADAANRGAALSVVSTVGFVVGIAGAGIGVVLLATSKSPRKAAAGLSLVPGGAALGVSGSF